MRRWYTVLFLMVGLLVMMSFTKAQPAFALSPLPPGTDGFWESFDTKGTGNFVNGDGWTNYNYYGGIASIVEEPDSTNKSLKLVDQDYDLSSEYRFGAYVLKEGFGSLSGKVVFETRYKVKKIEGYIPSYNIELFGGTQKAARFLQYSSGNYGFKTLSDATAHNYTIPGETVGSPLTADQWVTLKMVIDTTAKTYDITVQADSLKTYSGSVGSQATLDKATGTFKKTGIPLFSAFTGSEITKVQIYSNLYKGEMLFDYIALYEQPAQPEVTITAPNQVTGNSEFNVDVRLNRVYGTKEEDITLVYEPNLFDYIGTEGIVNNVYSSTVVNNVYHNALTGNLQIIASNPGEGNVINGDASIVRITFKARNVAASGQITVTNAIVADAAGNQTHIEILGATTVTVTATVMDKSTLLELISTTNALSISAQEGIENGAFIPGMLSGLKSALQQALASAQIVADNPNATAQDIDAAGLSLTNARNQFESKRITSTTGDINQSQHISIGDLGLTAGYYGKQASDPDWLSARVADINEDGIVDQDDLLFISQRITQF